MTNREVAWGAGGLAVGVLAVLTTAFLILRHRDASPPRAPDAATAEPVPLKPLDPEPEPDEPEEAHADASGGSSSASPAVPATSSGRDAATPHDAAGGVVHAA